MAGNGQDDEVAARGWLRDLRQQRGGSLRSVAKAVGSSKTELSRIETGQSRPSRELASLLDEYFEAHGALAAAFDEEPEDEERVFLASARRAEWIHLYPAAFSGQVWMMVDVGVGTDATVDTEMRWGPWLRRERFVVAGRLALLFKKGDDGQSVPLLVRVDPPCTVTFGTNDPPPDVETFDANPGWVHD